MASRREAREDRLNQRLRGAQRAPIGSDDTFGIDLEGIAPVQPLPSSSSPTTAAQPTPPLVRDSPLSPPRDVRVAYSDDLSREQDDERPAPEQSPTPSPQAVSSIPADNNSTPLARNARVPSEPDEPYAPEPLQAPSSDPSFAVQRVQREELLEEVTESPAKKPGSGQRRRIPVNTAAPQPTSTGFRVQSSSSSSGSGDRQSPTPLARRNTRPDNPPRRPAPPLPPPSAPVVLPSQRESRPQPPPAPPQSRPQRAESSDVGSEPSDPSDEEAVEISAKAASKVIGRKRPRSSLASQDSLTTSIEDTTSSAAPSSRSPAQQRQPAKRSKQSLSTAAIRRVRQERGPAKESRRQRHTSSSEQNDDRAVEITVQRLVNNFPRDADDEDELQQEIPFANRGGETVVDVFAQVCEEVINSTLDHLERMAMASDDADKKKECRIQMRAIGAYREELSSRLLQHAIHLNHWHSLRRRLRHVQKEKLALRDEIIRLKGEREQVALRMDAIRIKHEADSKESTSRLNASALMYDIDLAVEQGREAPELPPSAEQKAELGNLDLILAQISDQISPDSATGGLLQQVKDFNAFLERAAVALESR